MAGLPTFCRLGRLIRICGGAIICLLVLAIFHVNRRSGSDWGNVKLSRVSYEVREDKNGGQFLERPSPRSGSLPDLVMKPAWREVNTTTTHLNESPFTPAEPIEPNWTTTSYKSPTLTKQATSVEVTNMYKTAKKLRHLYANPRLKFDKFTIIMLSYNRTVNLFTIFEHYCTMGRIIDKILIIWNNIGVPVPPPLHSIPCSFPIVILPQTHNSLNNRFIPYPEIETECVFSLDDDHLMTEKSLEIGFNIWKTFPHLLVGYVPRTHGMKQQQYYYQREPVRHGEIYSIVLTVAMYMNYKYMDLYTNHAHKEIIQFTDANQNGEDIAMVAVVGDYLEKVDKKQCGCLWVREPMKEIKPKSDKKGKPKGLHHLARHFEERDDCLNLLAQLYGTLPIQYCSIEVRKKK